MSTQQINVCCLLLLLLGLVTSNLYGQEGELDVTGTVISSDEDEPLPGVNVLVKGTSMGTVTDVEGNYSITVPDEDAVLVFSSVGYETEEVTVGNNTTIDIRLAPDLQSLSEVVVVGYGTQKKSDITGAISSVSSKDISEVPVTNAQQALQGRAAGVDVVRQGNRPGQGVTVRVRGRRSFSASNDPLYVVDGIPLSGGINDINPQDIESMEVLKDASATAIYGSRGANGVVLITTKRGSAQQTSVTYDAYYGVSSPIGKVDMMDGEQFAEFKRESRRAVGRYTSDEDIFTPVELESIAQGRWTDYQELVTGKGHQQSHQIGVQGGNEKSQFALSGNFFDETGIVQGQDFKRYSARINFDHNITDKLKVGTSTTVARSIQNWGSNPYPSALNENPLGVPYDEDGNVILRPTGDGLTVNPLADLVEGKYIDERKRLRIFSNLFGEYKIAEGLTYRLNFGPDITINRRGLFQGSMTSARGEGNPYASARYDELFAYTLENILNYSKNFNDIHQFNGTLLYSIQEQKSEYLSGSASNLPYESQKFYNLGSAAEVEGLGSNLEEWGIESYMARLNYSFNDKYLLTLTGRVDGSSRLSEGKKYGFFPSLAVGWRIIDENFMQNQEFLTDLKLRGTYGKTGNTAIAPYQTHGGLARVIYAFGDEPGFGYEPDILPNPNLRWETSTSFNVGLDFGILDNRLVGSIEGYQTNTSDLLMERQLPTIYGYSSVIENIGATRNTGIELSLSSINVDTQGGFRWSTDLNLYANREEIVELYGGKEDDVGNRWFIGQPMSIFFDHEKIGIWQINESDLAESYNQNPGEIKIKDQNKDGSINDDDRVIIGSDIPDWSGGMTNRFSFKGFDLSVFVFARYGQMIRSQYHDVFNTLQGRFNNLNIDYWTPDNPTNAYPRPNTDQERPLYSTSMSYYDGSFLKVRNILLAYNLPQSLLDNTFISSLRVYLNAQQPFIFSNYDFIDPETDDGQVDADIPSSRLILFGINAKF